MVLLPHPAVSLDTEMSTVQPSPMSENLLKSNIESRNQEQKAMSHLIGPCFDVKTESNLGLSGCHRPGQNSAGDLRLFPLADSKALSRVLAP